MLQLPVTLNRFDAVVVHAVSPFIEWTLYDVCFLWYMHDLKVDVKSDLLPYE